MRILHCVHSFSPVSQTFIYDLVCRQARDPGYELKVVCKERLNTQQRPFPTVGCFPCRLGVSPTKARLLYDLPGLSSWLFKDRPLVKEVLTFDPEIVHFHFGWAAINCLDALERSGCRAKYVISLHGADVAILPRISWRYRRLMARLALNKKVKFTVPSEFLRSRAMKELRLPLSRIKVIPNTFNGAVFYSPEIRKQGPRIVTVGRLIACKGHALLLEALNQLQQQGIDFQLDIIGNGRLKQRLERLIDQYGLNEKVSFLGELNAQQIAKVFSDANLYVQPSVVTKWGEVDTFGVASLEALAAGLPVVVTKVGGLPDTVKGGLAGYASVCEPNVQSLSEAIGQALRVPAPEAAQSYRESVLQTYSEAKQDEAFSDLYKELLQSK